MLTAAAKVPDLRTAPDSHPQEFLHTSVLIIDDDAVYRTLLRDVCRRLGVGKILEAADGESGLALFAASKADLVLLDVVMPGIDGLEVCRRLRAQSGLSETAILIQSGFSDEARRVAAFQAGANDMVSKPMNFPEFTARVRAHLEIAVARHALTVSHDRLAEMLASADDLMLALQPEALKAVTIASHNGFDLTVTQRRHLNVRGDVWYMHEVGAGRLLFLLLDPNKPGLNGAITTLRLDMAIRELWQVHSTPQRLLLALDNRMATAPCGRLFASATAILVDREAGTLDYCASGNPAPIFCRNQEASLLKCGGLPLGSGFAQLEEHRIKMKIGDLVVLHTDGWPASGKKEPLALMQEACALGRVTAEQLLDPTAPVQDDVTLITLRKLC